MPRYPIASFNGRIVPAEQATVSAFNVEYNYGFGVYETLRVVKGVPYFVDLHIERLLRSAEIIVLSHPFDSQSVHMWILDLIAGITDEVFNLKILLIGAPDPREVQLFILPLAPTFPDRKWYRDGVGVISQEYERLFPQAKTLNMLGSYLAYAKAKKSGCYDALLLSRAGKFLEGTSTNLFFTRGDTLLTAPLFHVLDGVSRRITLHVARKEGIAVQEALIGPDDLTGIDGAFLTSTSTKALPIKQIDAHAFAKISPLALRVGDLYAEFLEGCGGLLGSSHA